ncbi:TPA: hypothetical protein ACGPAZ_000297 [Streptococcus suis]|uniref:hypothetical protein n=1 Tax=Streptococcus parauberis TaxID=1348 RepID=UPI000789BA02|nr:hypothetical protein [Streptococcus parauberis]KYP25214.1 hypothetical protein TM50_01430 [Streptococcus parauberis]KYP25678.1 hypothetical protein ADO04_00274 [Streptococcus parauberis]
MKFKIITSLIFIILIIIKFFIPTIQIDLITIILVVLSIVPWFFQYIKSLEITGIGKIDLITPEMKEQISKKAISIGISTKEREINRDKYTFYKLKNEDKTLALAGLRIEIEHALNQLLQKSSPNETNELRRLGIRQLANILLKNKIISLDEYDLINSITHTLNRAVHNELSREDVKNVDYILDVGTNLLETLSLK